MTPELLKELRAAGKRAAKGPWSVAHWDSPREWEAGWQIDAPGVDDCIVEAGHGREGSICDAEFIALAREHWDALLDAAEERDRLRERAEATRASTDRHRLTCEAWHPTLWGVVANAGRLSTTSKFRWSHVCDATGLGSQSARKLCTDFNFDPDELVGGAKAREPKDICRGCKQSGCRGECL